MIRWEKQGRIFAPDGRYEWMRSHAALPVPLQVSASEFRIYFASRDAANRSHIGSVTVSARDPHSALTVSAAPHLEPGPIGHFDDHGVYAASIVRHDGLVYLYYIGWSPGARAPLFYSSIGLAISEDGGERFRRISRAPILARSEHDPCLVTSPCVTVEDGVWRMWYVSGFKWVEEPDGLHSYYHIKYAESEDGIRWRREGRVCIDLLPGERNVARPCVLPGPDGYRMWYSYNRGAGYRIGFAESADGLDWERRDAAAGIEPSAGGWDSEAQAYPWVFRHENQLLMLYNGNGFGRDGFGLALAKEAGAGSGEAA